MVATIVLLSLLMFCVDSVPSKHALQNECKYNKLDPGRYRCDLVDDKISFDVDCIDGTMYINPEQQSLYHYHKQAELQMKFVLILETNHESESDISAQNLPIEYLTKHINENENEGDPTLNSDSLESEELTTSQKKSVNLTAEYIVYGVIIVMALIFTLGIGLLIYWWCYHKFVFSDKIRVHNNETQPFIDIRSENTIQRQSSGMKNDNNINNSQNNNLDVYHDIINGVNDNEDGDDLIAHYGSTTISNCNINNNNQNHGYVIGQYQN
eukprot:197773_1